VKDTVFRDDGSAQRSDPGDEAALELSGIERRKGITEMIVGRCAISNGLEAAQKRQTSCSGTAR